MSQHSCVTDIFIFTLLDSNQIKDYYEAILELDFIYMKNEKKGESNSKLCRLLITYHISSENIIIDISRQMRKLSSCTITNKRKILYRSVKVGWSQKRLQPFWSHHHQKQHLFCCCLNSSVLICLSFQVIRSKARWRSLNIKIQVQSNMK